MNNLQPGSDHPTGFAYQSPSTTIKDEGTSTETSPEISVEKKKSAATAKKISLAPPIRSFTHPPRESLSTPPQVQRSLTQIPKMPKAVHKSKFTYDLKNLKEYKEYIDAADDEQLKTIVNSFFPHFINSLVENDNEKHRLLEACKNFDKGISGGAAKKIISRIIDQHNLEDEFGVKALDDNFLNEIKALRKRVGK